MEDNNNNGSKPKRAKLEPPELRRLPQTTRRQRGRSVSSPINVPEQGGSANIDDRWSWYHQGLSSFDLVQQASEIDRHQHGEAEPFSSLTTEASISAVAPTEPPILPTSSRSMSTQLELNVVMSPDSPNPSQQASPSPSSDIFEFTDDDGRETPELPAHFGLYRQKQMQHATETITAGSSRQPYGNVCATVEEPQPGTSDGYSSVFTQLESQNLGTDNNNMSTYMHSYCSQMPRSNTGAGMSSGAGTSSAPGPSGMCSRPEEQPDVEQTSKYMVNINMDSYSEFPELKDYDERQAAYEDALFGFTHLEEDIHQQQPQRYFEWHTPTPTIKPTTTIKKKYPSLPVRIQLANSSHTIVSAESSTVTTVAQVSEAEALTYPNPDVVSQLIINEEEEDDTQEVQSTTA